MSTNKPAGGAQFTPSNKELHHQRTPLQKAAHAVPMLYAEAFAGSNNKEFIMELYNDAALLETAAPAMYEALQEARDYIRQLVDSKEDEAIDNLTNNGEDVEERLNQIIAQAEGSL